MSIPTSALHSALIDCSHTRVTMISMKRLMLMGMAVILLAGCSSSGSGKTTVACEQQFWNSMFAACLPKGWRVLSTETLRQLGVPEETVAAFQFETPHAGQLDTVTVTREPLSTDLTTPEYSQSNLLAVSSLPDYRLIDKETVYIDGAESALHVFSARPSADQPIRRYYQISASQEKTGYTFTGSFPLSIQDTEADQVKFILKNVSFKDPATVETK